MTSDLPPESPEILETPPWAQLRSRLGLGPVLDAILPAVAFLAGLELGIGASGGHGLAAGVVAAIAVAAVISVVRLVRHEGLRPVLISFAFVVVAAVLVGRSGQAADFFLPDLVLNGVLALWFAGSLCRGRPATVTVLRLLGIRPRDGETPCYLRGQRANTAVWLAFWCAHLAMGIPLYLAHQAVWLGATRVAFGPVLWLPMAWLGWRAARRAAGRVSPAGPAASG